MPEDKHEHEPMSATMAKLWRRKCSLDGPTAVKPTTQSPLGDIKFPRPITHQLCSPIECNASVPSAIAVLMIASNPRTIILAVTQIVVLAFKGVLGGGSRTHIGKKPGKRFKPFITHGNAASTVVLERGAFRIYATPKHVSPRMVFGRVTHTQSAVTIRSDWSSLYDFPCEAPATARVVLEIASQNDCRVAACAAAEPASIAIDSANISFDREAAELLSGQILKLWAIGVRMCFSHEMRLSLEGHLWSEPGRRSSATRLASLYQIAA